MSRRSLVFLLSISLMFAAVAVQAQGHGQGKGKNKQAQRDDDRDRGGIIFSTRDRQIIHDYYRGGYSNLPPGLAKRGGNLPPGLEKHLAKNGTLPPGLQKRLTPFPADLDRRLPRLPDIYRRGTIGGSVVIIDRRTQRIMDVIDDIIRP
jgi:hypothetical protein